MKGARMDGLHKKVAIAFVVILILVLVSFSLLFIWPTVYRYDHMNLGGTVLPVKINRLTGKTEVLYPTGWRVAGTGETGRKDLPASELAKITGNAEITLYGWIHFHPYNGSEWRVEEIQVEVTVRENDTVVLQRRYNLSGNALYPFNSGEFIADLGFKLNPGQTWSFRIISAKGTT
jgi:hypothetical protein